MPARAAYPPLLPTLLRGSGPYDEITTTRSAFLPQFGQWGPGGPWAYGQYYGPDSPFGDTGRTGFFGPTLGSLSFSQDFMVYAGIRFGPGGIGDIPEYRKRGLAVEEQRARADRLNARVHYEAARAAAHVVAARDRLEAAKTGLEASQEAFRLERDRFEKGIAIQLDVLDARAVLVNAESSEVEAIVDYDDAQYELLTTIGRTTPLSR